LKLRLFVFLFGRFLGVSESSEQGEDDLNSPTWWINVTTGFRDRGITLQQNCERLVIASTMNLEDFFDIDAASTAGPSHSKHSGSVIAHTSVTIEDEDEDEVITGCPPLPADDPRLLVGPDDRSNPQWNEKSNNRCAPSIYAIVIPSH
jgi:hypothetical protein